MTNPDRTRISILSSQSANSPSESDVSTESSSIEYNSVELGLKNILVQTIYSVKQAQKSNNIYPDISIELVEIKPDIWELTFNDNGLGYSKETIEEQLQKSPNECSKLFAAYKLCGKYGELYLNTKSRKTDEVLVGKLQKHSIEVTSQTTEQEYGTSLSMYLHNSINPNQLRDLISKHMRGSTIPITFKFKRHNTKESVIEHTPKPLFEKHTHQHSVRYSCDSYTVVANPEIQSELYVNNLTYDISSFIKIPWGVQIAVHTNQPQIISTDGFKNMSEQQDISEQNKKSEIYSPYYTNNYKTLNGISSFVPYVLQMHVIPQITSVLQRICSEKTVSKDDMLFLYSVIDHTADDVIKYIQHQFDLSSEEITSIEPLISPKYSLTENTVSLETAPFSEQYSESQLHSVCSIVNLQNESCNPIHVYYGSTKNELKYAIACTLYSNVVFVSVPTSVYSDVSSLHNWRSLKDISTDPDEYTNSNEIKKLINQDAEGIPIPQKKIQLRFGTNKKLQDRMQKITVTELLDHVSQNQNTIKRHNPSKILLFSDDSDYNISEYYSIGGPNIALTRCDEQTATYLLENDPTTIIQPFESYVEQTQQEQVLTTKGMHSISAVLSSDEVVHIFVVQPSVYKQINPNMASIETFKKLYVEVTSYTHTIDQPDLSIVLTPTQEQKLRSQLVQYTANNSISLFLAENKYSLSNQPSWTQTIIIDELKFIGLLISLDNKNEKLTEFFRSATFSHNTETESIIQYLLHTVQNSDFTSFLEDESI